MERSSMGAISFAGSEMDCPVSRESTSAWSSKSRWMLAEKFNDKLHGMSTAMAQSLNLPCWPPLPPMGLKHHVTIDNDPHRNPLPDRQGGLDVEIALKGFCPVGFILRRDPYARPEFGPLASLNSGGACETLHTASIKSRTARASQSISSIGSLQYGDVTYAA
jgi:hypothetical protein